VNSFFRPSTTITCVSPDPSYNTSTKKDYRPRSDERPVETLNDWDERHCAVVVKRKERRKGEETSNECRLGNMIEIALIWKKETSITKRWLKQQLKRCQNLIQISDTANGIPNATRQSTNPDAQHQPHQRSELIAHTCPIGRLPTDTYSVWDSE
jgi:hypothetical protein